MISRAVTASSSMVSTLATRLRYGYSTRKQAARTILIRGATRRSALRRSWVALAVRWRAVPVGIEMAGRLGVDSTEPPVVGSPPAVVLHAVAICRLLIEHHWQVCDADASSKPLRR